MHVSPILNAKNRFAYSLNYTSRTIMTNKQNNNSDTFQKSALPSFKGYCVNKKLFNIIGESDDKLKTLAEVFYKEPDSQIKKACETTILNTGKISFHYMNSVLINDKNIVPKTSEKKKTNSTFTEREYNSSDILSALRKKQNG